MSGSGSKGKWEASSITEKDVKELQVAGYLSTDIAHRLPAKDQGWTKKAEQIDCPAPLPENPATPQLTEMLVLAPYQAPEKKAKKKGKENKGGPRHRGPSDAMSGETEALSCHEGGEDEEEEEAESDSPHKGRKKKRTASEDPEEEAPKRGNIVLQDSSDSESEQIRKKLPRAKPLAASPPCELLNTPLSEGSYLPPDMAEIETPPRAPSPLTADDTEVLSQRTSPGRGGAGVAVEKAPEGNTLVAEDMGEVTPMETDGGDRQHSGPQLDTPPETNASPLAATAQAAEVSELNRKLKVADEEIDRINKRFDETQVSAAEVETLKGALARAQKEAKANKAAVDKAAAELKTEQAARRQHEAWVTEVQQELKDAILKCKGLEDKALAQSFELAKALQDAKAAQVESRSAREEIH
nr:fibrous sheath CABYR-binding protein-like [Aegilops tauschii subsp. strangulata]